jgi:methyl-accepting chemotaxis protein
MNIGRKLGFAIGPLVILSLCLVIFSYQTMKQVQMQIPNISEFAITATKLSCSINTAFYRQNRFYEEVVFMHDLEMLKNAQNISSEIVQILEKLKKLDGISQETSVMLDNALKIYKNYIDSASRIYRQLSENENYLEDPENARAVNALGEEKNNLEKIFTGFSEIIRKDVSRKIESVEYEATQRNYFNMVISFLVIGISVIIIFLLIKRGIIKPVSIVIRGLNESAEAVASASQQISSSAHSVAHGTSEQAASSEEIASVMEEISSTTAQNAEHAKQADAMMKDLRLAVEFANRSMSDLSVSMDEISKAGEKTSDILKSIEKIAFQTNLLSLNAAVEAARAGESGAGFSIVAEEVRNLAGRAARSSKSTSDLIGDISRKLKEGSDSVTGTRDAFVNVVETSANVASLMEEISSAYGEQAKSIQQISMAIAESDQLIQQSAASAEESASASEKMNTQAEQMKAFVRELVLLIRGHKTPYASG